MPHDAVAVGYKVVEKDAHGGHDLVLRATHEAPANDDGGVAEDPFKEYDLFVANRAIEVLLTAYPGYPWTAKHDTVLNRETGNHDKLLLIAIPILMGVNNYMAINRQTTSADTRPHHRCRRRDSGALRLSPRADAARRIPRRACQELRARRPLTQSAGVIHGSPERSDRRPKTYPSGTVGTITPNDNNVSATICSVLVVSCTVAGNIVVRIDFLGMVRECESQALLYVQQANRRAWSQSYRAFHNEHYIGSKYTRPDWRGRSKLFVPKTRAAVRKDNAAVAASLFNSIDAINCLPGNESDPKQRAAAALMQELVNYRTGRASGKARSPGSLSPWARARMPCSPASAARSSTGSRSTARPEETVLVRRDGVLDEEKTARRLQARCRPPGRG
jgi:hypothetical protein